MVDIPKQFQDKKFWVKFEDCPFADELRPLFLNYKKELTRSLKDFKHYQIGDHKFLDLSGMAEKLEIWYSSFEKKVIIGFTDIQDRYARWIEFGNSFNLPMKIFSKLNKEFEK
jgi:hypothetical protein